MRAQAAAAVGPVDPTQLRFGIEAEFALVDPADGLLDFDALTWARAARIVDRLDGSTPPTLTRGDLGIKQGRWYVEGDERFDPTGTFLRCVPKGLETRTTPTVGIDAAVRLLASQTDHLAAAAASDGLRLGVIGWNPRSRGYWPQPAYNGWEVAMRRDHTAFTAPDVYMMSYGPDVNLSHPAWDDAAAIAVGRRLTAVSPAIVPFSFSAPFARGGRCAALSMRTALRTGRRPAARVFVAADAVPDRQPAPPLVHPARIPAERGRIEFKAFDALVDPALYPPLLALVAGIALSGAGGAGVAVPDAQRHADAAMHGFDDPRTADEALRLLSTARHALRTMPWGDLLDPLYAMLARRRTPAHDLIDTWTATGTVPVPLIAPSAGATMEARREPM